MQKREIGHLLVSQIGMECMGVSHGYGQVPSEKYAIEAIRNAYQEGCTFLIPLKLMVKKCLKQGITNVL